MSIDPNELNEVLIHNEDIEQQMILKEEPADLTIETQTDAEQVKPEEINAYDAVFSRPPQEDSDGAGLMSAWGAGMVYADWSKDRELRKHERDKRPRLHDDDDDKDGSDESCC